MALSIGASALAALRQKEYDLVITDWQMQPISEVELTKLIRADARLSKVRIILITGLHGKDDEAWLDGADGYITKPFEPRDLTEKAEDVLPRSRCWPEQTDWQLISAADCIRASTRGPAQVSAAICDTAIHGCEIPAPD